MSRRQTPLRSLSPIGRRRFAAFAATAVLAAPAIARGQTAWRPSRPITIYNPFAPGGVTDIHMRFLAERATKTLGQQVLIEPKLGAGGTLAAAQMQHAKPDGHTLACMSINSLRYPHYQETSWDPLRDFAYIIGLSAYTMGIVVRTDSRWQTIEELIAAGKREPEKYNYGTSGAGGTGQLLMIEVEQATGAKFTSVPYKGGAEWMQALMGGHIDFISDAAQWAPFVEAKQARILAMATEERFPRFPDAPTLTERGIKAVGLSPYGLVGPKDLSPAIITAVHDAFKEAMADPAHDKLLDQYIQGPWYKSPADYRAFAEKYFRDIRPILMKAGLAKG
ncbi:tripartite tricarboxylate transporter substrate binding protein [Reyranella sp. CPCC 100927]|uniref:tripartite tricarboxylate transporter substrate binding protein n=1 Tax=Reyranella sp. CPCC 100927 TaxID=2599616 RepID=UPI0011B5B8D0|nr:tripartite tricarboxylate transporter substrate binding protein [Reyranella sp. CPCC 100927]TWT03942.1 tripartite tricarboxylate transporter substrate binding protein [Reyranella sp. CPCC 100927]